MSRAVEYSGSAKPLVKQLTSVEMNGVAWLASGKAIGEDGRPGTYRRLLPQFQLSAGNADLKLMLKDKNAAVRIMAAQCVMLQKLDHTVPKELDDLVTEVGKQKDPIIWADQRGDVVEMTTVSAILARIALSPKTFAQ
ncbi:hypothetical protein llg_15380 [Luteolibacter sp. LG18]|nr:hypothetical protein llg_15380 [Luteolibacter sp. LG18]